MSSQWLIATAACAALAAAGSFLVAFLQWRTSAAALRLALFPERKKILDVAQEYVKANACKELSVEIEERFLYVLHRAPYLLPHDACASLRRIGDLTFELKYAIKRAERFTDEADRIAKGDACAEIDIKIHDEFSDFLALISPHLQVDHSERLQRDVDKLLGVEGETNSE